MSESKMLPVNNKKTGLVGFENVILLPGVTMVDAGIVKRMQSHPVIKIMETEGELEFPKFSEEEGVSNLSTNEALDLVKSTVDKDVLESWAKSEKRKPVLSAIEKQLAELNKPIERRSDSSKK